jgi:predicted DsbA family dithiol-disulfide isomerase
LQTLSGVSKRVPPGANFELIALLKALTIKQKVMTKPKLKISVVSDVVCPWCYIGKRRLEKAIDNLSDRFDFEVEYFPFELNPQMPKEGVNQRQYLSNKFGGEERYNQITAHTTATAAQEGLTFDFAAQKISPNTRNAHRLIQLAKEDGLHVKLVDLFFKAYFTEGQNLADNKTLTKIAVAAGMNRAKVEELLDSTTGEAEVEIAERELQKLGISGVPFYIVDNKFGISGAQAPETFMKAFEEIALTPAVEGGESCDVDAKNC